MDLDTEPTEEIVMNFSDIEFALSDFSVVYQPIFDVQTGSIEKIEALTRWTRSNDVCGFIEHFEATGQIKELTFHLIETVCTDVTALSAAWKHPVVTLNFAPLVLADHDFVEGVISLFALNHVPPDWIEIEITEAERLNPNAVAAGVKMLSEKGFRISLDDFGAGATTLGCLVNMPIDVIKLDRSYIARVGESFANRAILSTVAHLRTELNIECVVEGIETQVQMEFLKKIDMDYAQGFLLSKPIALNEFVRLLAATHEFGGIDIRRQAIY